MEPLQELIQALTLSIETLNSTLASSGVKAYIVPVITGLIGTFSGLAVVILQTKNADRRADAQREEDRRKDVYKSAAVELAKLPRHIMSLRQVTEGKQMNSDELLNMTGVLAQMIQVAPPATAQIAMELSGEIGKLGTNAINELRMLQVLQNKNESVKVQLLQVEEFHKETLNEVRRAGIQDGPTEENKKFFDETLEFGKRQFNELSVKQNELMTLIADTQISYLQWCKANLTHPMNICFELQLRIRKDFGNEDGESVLREQHRKQQQKFDELFEETIENLKAAIVENRSMKL